MIRFIKEIFSYLRQYLFTTSLIGICLLIELAFSSLLPLGVKYLVDSAVVPHNREVLLRLLGGSGMYFQPRPDQPGQTSR